MNLRGVGWLILVCVVLIGCNPSAENDQTTNDTTTDDDSSNTTNTNSSEENSSVSPESSLPVIVDLGTAFKRRGIEGSSYYHSESPYRIDFEKLEGVRGTGHIRHLVDLNNDVVPELLTLNGVAESADSTVKTEVYRIANETAELYNPWNTSAPELVWPRKSLIADFDGNGHLDAVLLGHGWDKDPFPGESVQYFLNDDGTLTTYVINGTAKVGNIRAFWHGGSAADIDGDGDIDLVLSDADAIRIFENRGDGTFEPPTSLTDSAGFYTLELVDINGDGNADILGGGHEFDGTPTAYALGNGKGDFPDSPVELPAIATFGVVVDVDVFDANGDDFLEILVTRTGGTSSAADTNFYEGYHIQLLTSSDEGYVSSTIAESTTGDWVEWLHIQDIDGDSKLEAYSDLLNSGLEWDLE
ncbi:FG-GAP-like repeat-containing protein [Salinispirillum marinum]|uniref:FG-GAP-like repeat-containing protein n=2 Tax=Saccharospirillaceae TaxID=255527 RepID=A0ABV8BCU2_9GAMM